MAIFTFTVGRSALLALCSALGLQSLGHAGNTIDPAESAVRREVIQWLGNEAARLHLTETNHTLHIVPSSHSPGGLARCAKPYTVQPLDTTQLSRLRFSARCPDQPGLEKLYTVRVELNGRILVAKQDIPNGQTLTADDVALALHPISDLTDVITESATVLGLSTRASFRNGQAIRKKLLEKALLIKRGQPVDIVARQEQIEVSVAGEAQENGRLNEVIRVKNKSNGKTIKARVIAEGLVSPLD